jgi:hypothetical protein
MSFGNFRIDEGVDPYTGVRTQIHFEGDQVVVQKTYDAEPYLQRVAEMRARNEGKKWGEGKEVGVIPPWVHQKINMIQDDAERERVMKEFFRENPAFLAYEAFVK